LVCAQQAEATVSYHIGNSLTWDSQPLSLQAMAAARGKTHVVGHHIRCGSSLPLIAGDDKTCVDPVAAFGTWRNALANHAFDTVVMQPHTRSSLAQDQAVISEMIDIAAAGPGGSGTRFLIYQAWPMTGPTAADFGATWDTATPDADAQAMVYTRDYFNHLIQRARADRPGVTIDIIPVGEVFDELDARLKSGELQVADYTSANDFYRDGVHLHMNALGRFVAASTQYAVIFNEDPSGLARPSSFFDNADIPSLGIDWDAELLTPQVQADLQAVVWDVVGGPAYTNIPEPTSAMILAIAGVGLTCRRRSMR